MVEKPSGHPLLIAPWLPWVLGLALLTIVGSHLSAWVNSLSLARAIRTQQELFVELTTYQELLSDLDESIRAVMLAPERAELRQKKAEAVEALQHQLETLADKAPIGGPIPKELIGLATHFRKKLVKEADQVQKHAAAPGPFAMDRFRTEYAEVRLQHADRVGRLLNLSHNLADDSLSAGYHRLLLSAGLLLVIWSGVMAWLVGRARLQPPTIELSTVAHVKVKADHHSPAAPESPVPSSGESHRNPSPPAEVPNGLAEDHHTPAAVPSIGPAVPDPLAPPPREPEPVPAMDSLSTAPAPVAVMSAPAAAAPSAGPTAPSASAVVANSGGEMSQSQIAELLSGPGSSAPAATPPAQEDPVATAAPPREAAPVAASPAASSALPPGPVDLASLMGDAAEEPAAPQPSSSEPTSAAAAPPSPEPAPPQPTAAAAPGPAPASLPAEPVANVAPPVAEDPQAQPEPSPAPAATQSASLTEQPPVAHSEPEAPAPVESPAPLPDVQTLMKGASAMTTEQLTAMLFGAAPATPSKSPAPAPTPAPAVPPRTITGAEMAAVKPGEDTPGVVDLSF